MATPVGPATAATTPIDTRAPAAPAAAVDPGEGEQVAPLVVPLAAGGAVAAAGVLAALLCLRRQQFRYRRPGRSIATSGPDLVPVEKAAVTVGAPAAGEIARLHEVLRHVAATDIEVLDLAAVQLTGSTITMHLARAASLPQPWQPVDQTGMAWRFPGSAAVNEAGSDPEEIGVIGPFPALVHVGSDATSSWLLNLEQIGGLVLTGDHDRCLNLARVVAAQLGLNPWADCIGVTLLGFGAELLDAAPERLRYATATEAAAVLSATRANAERRRSARWTSASTSSKRAGKPPSTRCGHRSVLLVAGDRPDRRHRQHQHRHRPALCRYRCHDAAVPSCCRWCTARPEPTGAAVVVVDGSGSPTTHQRRRRHAGAPGRRRHADPAGVGLTVQATGWDEETSRGVGMLMAHACATRPTSRSPTPPANSLGMQLTDSRRRVAGRTGPARATPTVHDSSRAAGATTLPLADQAYLERPPPPTRTCRSWPRPCPRTCSSR